MRVVADTNIIFSAIISAKGLERDVLIRPPKKLKLYAPYYLREEIMEHLPKLQKISGLPRLEVLESFELVTKHIFFFSEELIPLATWMKAYEEMNEVDMDDIPFAASAMYLKARLWTGDKKFKKLKKGGYSFELVNTTELKGLITHG